MRPNCCLGRHVSCAVKEHKDKSKGKSLGTDMRRAQHLLFIKASSIHGLLASLRSIISVCSWTGPWAEASTWCDPCSILLTHGFRRNFDATQVARHATIPRRLQTGTQPAMIGEEVHFAWTSAKGQSVITSEKPSRHSHTRKNGQTSRNGPSWGSPGSFLFEGGYASSRGPSPHEVRFIGKWRWHGPPPRSVLTHTLPFRSNLTKSCFLNRNGKTERNRNTKRHILWHGSDCRSALTARNGAATLLEKAIIFVLLGRSSVLPAVRRPIVVVT